MSRRKKVKGRPEKSALLKPQEGGARIAQRRGRRWDKIVTVVLVAAVISLVAVSTFFKLSGSSQQSPELTAVIADELALTDPNPTFVDAATRVLEQAGYAVDYYGGEEVTVDFYRELPKRDYELIVFRTHAARLRDEQDALTDDAGLFTSEPYSKTRYVAEQRADRLRPARYFESAEAVSVYFGITPRFVESSMKGTFQGTTVIIMGCDGLRSDRLAGALVERGANAVVSWSGLVSAQHTDAATEQLLRHFVSEGLPLREAVAATTAELGPDPAFGSVLRLYPSQGG